MESTARLLWRIDKKEFKESIFSGHGSARYPGRWNLSGMPVVYCSSTLSLAALEKLVQASQAVLGKMDHVAASLEVPLIVYKKREIMTVEDMENADENWRNIQHANSLKVRAGNWHKNKSSAILQVPSVVIPQENNFVLNPYHPDFKKISQNPPEEFKFDLRL